MRRLLLALPFTLLPLAAVQAADHAHDQEHEVHGSLDAHKHGVAQLNVVLDDQALELELESPAMNLVGFEHAATSAADKAKVAAVHSSLQQPLALFGLGAIGMLAIIALALLGVAPIISLSLCAALLAQLAGHGVAVMQPAVALLVGFSLAMLLSPYGPSALMLARHAGISPWRIAFGWNGRFVLLVLGPLLLVPLLA